MRKMDLFIPWRFFNWCKSFMSANTYSFLQKIMVTGFFYQPQTSQLLCWPQLRYNHTSSLGRLVFDSFETFSADPK